MTKRQTKKQSDLVESFRFRVAAVPDWYRRPVPGGKVGQQRRRVIAARQAAKWRGEVRWAALEALGLDRAPESPLWPAGVPLVLHAVLWLPRPASHYRSDGHTLKPSAPRFPTTRGTGDLSNLLKEIEDALGPSKRGALPAIAYPDDSQIVLYERPGKRYADGGKAPGALVALWPAGEDDGEDGEEEGHQEGRWNPRNPQGLG